MSSYVAGTSVTIMSPNDELSSTMNWVGCLLKDSELFILFAENSQILFKISVFPILLYSLKDIYWGLFHIETFLKKIKKMQGFSDEDLNPRTLHVRQQNIDNYINVIIEIKRYITLCCCHFLLSWWLYWTNECLSLPLCRKRKKNLEEIRDLNFHNFAQFLKKKTC